jgi:hypothetical protein
MATPPAPGEPFKSIAQSILQFTELPRVFEEVPSGKSMRLRGQTLVEDEDEDATMSDQGVGGGDGAGPSSGTEVSACGNIGAAKDMCCRSTCAW